MKKLLLALFSLLFTISFAQNKQENIWEGISIDNTLTPASIIQDQTTGTCDTIKNHKKNDALGFYAADAAFPLDSGYAFGHNKLLNKAFAEKFTLKTSNDLLSSIQLVFGYVKNSGNNGTITAKVWDNTGISGGPGAILSTQTVDINSIIKNAYTTVTFSSPVQVTNTFYAGFEVNYGTTDTLGLYSGQYGKVVPGTVWVQNKTNNWLNYGSLNVAMYCWAFMCGSTVGIAADATTENIQLYPNPTTGIITLEIPALQTTITIRSVTGQIVATAVGNATQTIKLDLSQQPEGVYFVAVQNEKESSNKKLVIAK